MNSAMKVNCGPLTSWVDLHQLEIILALQDRLGESVTHPSD